MKKIISILLIIVTTLISLLLFFYVIVQHGTIGNKQDNIVRANQHTHHVLRQSSKITREQALIKSINRLAPQKTPLKIPGDLLTNLAHNIEIKVQLTSKTKNNCHLLGAAGNLCYSSRIFIRNTGNFNITGHNWKLYLYSIRRILSVDNLYVNKYPSIYNLNGILNNKPLDTGGRFNLKFITGGLYEITPTKRFKMFERQSTTLINLTTEFQNISLTDVVPWWFFSVNGKLAPVSNMTNSSSPNNYVINTSTIPKSIMPHARYATNKKYDKTITTITKNSIIPTAKEIKYTSTQPTDIQGVALHIKGLSPASIKAIKAYLAEQHIKISKNGLPVFGDVNPDLMSKNYQEKESYSINTTTEKATIHGYDQQGLFYGLISFIQSIDAKNSSFLTSSIQDTPRYHHREQHIDIARHFHSVGTIKKMLHEMAFLKLNVLHLVIDNDEAWRLEIPGIPELTDVGSRICLDMTESQCLLPQLGIPLPTFNKAQYYTAEQYKDLIRYAHAHFITIIPEIDVPAHERAAVVSMEARYRKYKDTNPKLANEYRLFDPEDNTKVLTVQFYGENSFVNPAVKGTANFLDKVIGEITKMHSEAGVPLDVLHVGGDTVFNFMSTNAFTTKYEDNSKGLLNYTLNKPPLSSSPQIQKIVGSDNADDILSVFIDTLSAATKKHKIPRIQAWSQDNKILRIYHESKGLQVNFWFPMSSDIQERLLNVANNGVKIIMSMPDYTNFDFKYENNLAERGYYWASNNNSVFKLFSYMPDNLPANAEVFGAKDGSPIKVMGRFENPKVFGISAQLWSETLYTDQNIDYMLYPRMVALAQKAWHKNKWEPKYIPLRTYETGRTHIVDQKALHASFNRFINTLYYKLLPRYDKLHINYRVPPPGAMIRNKVLSANSEIPNLSIEYSFDKIIWHKYMGKTAMENHTTVYLRSPNFSGDRYGRIVTVKANDPNFDSSLYEMSPQD